MKSALAGTGLIVLVALAFALGLWMGHAERLKTSAALDAVNLAIAQIEIERDSLAKVASRSAARADTVYETRWLRARARIESLPVDVPVPYPVYVQDMNDADSTIEACQLARRDCAAQAAIDSALIDSLRSRGRLLERAAKGPRISIWGLAETDLDSRWYAGAELRARLPLLPLMGHLRATARLDSLAARDVRIGLQWRF